MSVQAGEYAFQVLLAADLHADEDMGGARIGEAVIELGDVAAADHGTEALEAARLFRNGHRDNGLAPLAQLGTLGHMAQAVEIHIGAAGNRHQGLILAALALHIGLGAGHRQSARRLHDGAGVFENILDRRADGVGVHQDDLVQQFATDAEGLLAHQLHRHPVGEQAHVLQLHPLALGNRLTHCVGIHRLHANHLDVRLQPLDEAGDAGGQTAAADGDEDRVQAVRMLTQNLHAYGALAGDHIRIVEWRNISHTVLSG